MLLGSLFFLSVRRGMSVVERFFQKVAIYLKRLKQCSHVVVLLA